MLDGIVGRLLRDGPSAVTTLVPMHDRLAPTIEEVRTRATDYTRLLLTPSAGIRSGRTLGWRRWR
ncbi:hypothetical protein ACIBQ1_54310 [Nonomuraea sp. NPDC050153]|uniref:hypothetical protein n=1 Tax=Nonomuraea sp. NPDC050153 TaxID=3364359 RepID=UPI0037BA31D0